MCDAVPIEEVNGEREYDVFAEYSYKFANTPKSDCKCKAKLLESKSL
ncbi:hypothetical protein Gotur_009550 [Gossypium turneri]